MLYLPFFHYLSVCLQWTQRRQIHIQRRASSACHAGLYRKAPSNCPRSSVECFPLCTTGPIRASRCARDCC
jgi:hypothetical protein